MFFTRVLVSLFEFGLMVVMSGVARRLWHCMQRLVLRSGVLTGKRRFAGLSVPWGS